MDIKVGDKVLVESRWNKSIQTVTEISPKGNIRISNGILYDANGAEKTSDVWNSSTITLLTLELKKQLNEEMVIKKAVAVMHDVKTVTFKQAVEIMKILSVDLERGRK